MKLKLDENLPRQLVPILTGLGHDVDTVPDEHLVGQDDDAVGTASQAAGRFLVTLLLVRLPQPGRNALVQRIPTLFRTEAVETWQGCLVSATPTKVRIKRVD